MAAGEAYSLYVEPAAEGANEADGPFSAAREGWKHGDDVAGNEHLIRLGVVSVHDREAREIGGNVEGGLDLRHGAARRQLERGMVAIGTCRQIGLERGEELDLDLHGLALVDERGGGDTELVAGVDTRGFIAVVPPGQLGRGEAVAPGDTAHGLSRFHDMDFRRAGLGSARARYRALPEASLNG
jgi:hypothetical protein